MKQADEIKIKLLDWAKASPADVVLPNYFMGAYEADVICIKTSGYVYEYEIKISRSDFKNDMKKGYGGSWSEKHNKHESLRDGKLHTNKFFFVVPEGMISSDECPPHAGLIYHTPTKALYHNTFTIKKPAKWLHRNTFTDWENFTRRLAHRHALAKRELSCLRNYEWLNEKRELNKEIANLEKLIKRQDADYFELQNELRQLKQSINHGICMSDADTGL